MFGFIDECVIEVMSGKGGNGCISFRREKYIPKGGPNGGDGGKGGDVVFCVKKNIRTLAKIRHRHIFKAKNGGDGQGWNRHGKDGADVVIEVPPGTTITDVETGELIHDFTNESEGELFVVLTGGKGGWGNIHFKSSTNQAPRIAHPGTPGEMRKLKLEMSIIADAGLVGFPNAGKSSLLTAFTNARPKIAPYPFTTKIPNLGVLRVDDEQDVVIADIPGIIEGASEGVGLGFEFLRHISRTSCLIFMIDASDEATCFTAYDTLVGELSAYADELLEKPRIVLCNKIDIEGAKDNAHKIADEIHKKEPKTPVIAISVEARYGLYNAQNEIIQLVSRQQAALDAGTAQQMDGSKVVFASVPHAPSKFLATRSIDEDAEVQYPGSEK